MVGWSCVLAGAAMLALYLWPGLQEYPVTAMAAAFIPHATVLWVLAGVILLLAGRRWGRAWAVVALAGGLLHAQVLVPYTSRFPEPPGPAYTVATLNLRFGEADLAALADSPALDAPVLVLTEASAATVATLDTKPWRTAYPYRVGQTDAWANGTLILSRDPLTVLKQPSGTPNAVVTVRVKTPLGPLVVIGAHLVSPVRDENVWQQDHRTLLGLTGSHPDDATVVVGDLNSTLEHLPVRRLLATGFTDAASAAGSGWQPTWPASRWFPPLIAIDHVLLNDRLVAADTRTFRVPGTDHLGLMATLQAA